LPERFDAVVYFHMHRIVDVGEHPGTFELVGDVSLESGDPHRDATISQLSICAVMCE
jgi:hypothetical protein